jgi:hypothetical protein
MVSLKGIVFESLKEQNFIGFSVFLGVYIFSFLPTLGHPTINIIAFVDRSGF